MSAFVHESAVIDEGASIGDGAKIWHFVHVCAGASVGAGSVLGQNVFVGRGVRIGRGVKVQNNVSIYEGVEIEDDVFLGPSCVFTNVVNPRAFVERKSEYRATRVGRGASIGANATIVCGHAIGEYAFVGAGAVVTREVPAHALVVGTPARRIGWMSRAGERLPEGREVACPRTGERYVIEGETCRRVADGGEEGEGAGDGEAPIPLLDLAAQHAPLTGALRAAFDRVLGSQRFILGEEVEALERECAEALGVEHAIGVSSGTDGLLVAMMALGIGPGDEVITTAFSFFATAGCIVRLGARPVLVDVEPGRLAIDPEKIEAAIGARTRAIMPVHLFGQAADMGAISEIARRRGIAVIEDAAQAFGARCGDDACGGIGAVGVFSFFPSKNLGALGDGGLVTTRDPGIADRVRLLRHHGMRPKYVHGAIGGNFRIDALQAALLRVKLPHVARWSAARRENARRYSELLAGIEGIATPREIEPGHVWNQYVIRVRERERVRARLASRGIATEVYYPLGLHMQPALADLGLREGAMPETERAASEVLALPVFPELGETRLARVAREVIAAVSS